MIFSADRPRVICVLAMMVLGAAGANPAQAQDSVYRPTQLEPEFPSKSASGHSSYQGEFAGDLQQVYTIYTVDDPLTPPAQRSAIIELPAPENVGFNGAGTGFSAVSNEGCASAACHPIEYGCSDCEIPEGGRIHRWFCRIRKKLIGTVREKQRRSECSFEYPVQLPFGCPYGYVEPTWTSFGTDQTSALYRYPAELVPREQ